MSWGPEDTVHVSVLEWLHKVLPDAEVFHVPNGGHRSLGTARKMKRLGVKPGVPDLIIWPGQGRTILFEIKGPRTAVSPAQRAIGLRATALGHAWAVVRSIEDARTALLAAGIAFKERVTP